MNATEALKQARGLLETVRFRVGLQSSGWARDLSLEIETFLALPSPVEEGRADHIGKAVALEQENARLRGALEGIRGHYRKSFKPCDCPTCEARAALSGDAPKEGT